MIDVDEVDADRLDVDQHLAWARFRRLDLDEFEDFRTTCFRHSNRVHGRAADCSEFSVLYSFGRFKTSSGRKIAGTRTWLNRILTRRNPPNRRFARRLSSFPHVILVELG